MNDADSDGEFDRVEWRLDLARHECPGPIPAAPETAMNGRGVGFGPIGALRTAILLPAMPRSVIMPVGARWPQELPVAFHAKGPAVSLFYLSVLLCVPTAAEPAPPDSVMFGKERMVFPKEFALPNKAEQDRIREHWRSIATAHANLPLRDGAELGSYDPGMYPCLVLRDTAKNIYSRPSWDNIGYFLRSINSAKQFEEVISFLCPNWKKQCLSVVQFERVVRAIDSAGPAVKLEIRSRAFDSEAVGRGFIHKDGCWLVGLVLINGPRVVEHKYAIDEKCRVAHVEHVLVEYTGITECLGDSDLGTKSPSNTAFPRPLSPQAMDVQRRLAEKPGAMRRMFVRAELEVEPQRWEQFIIWAALGSERIRALGDAHVAVRREALSHISWTGKWALEALPALRSAIGDPDPGVRLEAVLTVGEITDLKDPDPGVRAGGETRDAAARALALRRLGRGAQWAFDALPVLREALKSTDPRVRETAISEIARHSGYAKDAVPELRTAARDQDEDVRISAIRALGWIGPAAKDAVPELQDALGDSKPYIREFAAQSLGYIGPSAKGAVPDLRQARQNPDTYLRGLCDEAIERIESPVEMRREKPSQQTRKSDSQTHSKHD